MATEVLETVVCNSCGSTRSKRTLRGADVRCGTPGVFNVVRCSDCGLHYVNPRPTLEEIGKHYPPDYSEHTEGHWANPFVSTEADIVASYFDAPGSVLDIGCASGAFLLAMHHRGWRLSGTDTSEQAHEIAKAVPDADIRLGYLRRGDFPPASFDAITLWSVFEHLHDPLDTLRIIRELLKPEGRLFMVVPNYRGLERMIFRTRWFALELPRHLYHFTPETMEQMLHKGGFEVDKMQHASGHDTFRFSLRLMARKPMPEAPTLASENGDSGSSGPRPAPAETALAHRVNGAVVGAFTTMADKMALGSQLLVVAHPA
jgi:2-polyprenyl-3-methyl-5-hydroxy-6-metoxy-1,4-benzoquinol methylase